MTDHELSAFRELFEDLFFSGLARTPMQDRKEQVLATYFEALRPYPFAAVKAAHAQIQRAEKNWPTVSVWIAAIRSNPVSSLLLMTPEQQSESDEAERLFYEGPVCRCSECRFTHADHLPLRYVPLLDGNGRVMPIQHPNRQRPVILGEWIHGVRLKRWYAARAEFYLKLESPETRRESRTRECGSGE